MLFYGGITLHRLIFNVQQIQTESASWKYHLEKVVTLKNIKVISIINFRHLGSFLASGEKNNVVINFLISSSH